MEVTREVRKGDGGTKSKCFTITLNEDEVKRLIIFLTAVLTRPPEDSFVFSSIKDWLLQVAHNSEPKVHYIIETASSLLSQLTLCTWSPLYDTHEKQP